MHSSVLYSALFLTRFTFIDVLICAAVVLIVAFVVYIYIRRRSKRVNEEGRQK